MCLGILSPVVKVHIAASLSSSISAQILAERRTSLPTGICFHENVFGRLYDHQFHKLALSLHLYNYNAGSCGQSCLLWKMGEMTKSGDQMDIFVHEDRADSCSSTRQALGVFDRIS